MTSLTADEIYHAKRLARLSNTGEAMNKPKIEDTEIDAPLRHKFVALMIWVAIWGSGVLVLYFSLFNG
jgi:hypothetical protein